MKKMNVDYSVHFRVHGTSVQQKTKIRLRKLINLWIKAGYISHVLSKNQPNHGTCLLFSVQQKPVVVKPAFDQHMQTIAINT